MQSFKFEKMESDDENFAKRGGEALEIGDDFDSEEEADNMPSEPMKAQVAAASNPKPGVKAADVKGAKVEDQPFDLAVDVNDSEEIDSDEEEDEVNVDV